MHALLIILLSFSMSLENLRGEERLIFEDNFDTFDLRRWRHDITLGGGGNWEFELYWNNRTNSYVKDGILHIKPTLTVDRIGEAALQNGHTFDFWGQIPPEQCTSNEDYGCLRTSGAGGNILNPIQSAKISTFNSLQFRYGRMEVRAKMPVGDWIWPAIWLMPAQNEYGMWPTSGEIDLLESRGNLNYPKDCGGGPDSNGFVLHWGTDFWHNRYPQTFMAYRHPSGTLADDFHTYGLYWNEDRIFFYLDEEKNKIMEVDMTDKDFFTKGQFPPSFDNPWKGRGKNAPFDQEMYIIMNVAVGGTNGYFRDGVAGKPWSNTSPHAMNEFWASKNQWYSTWKGEDSALKVDWIKVWGFPNTRYRTSPY